MKVAFISAEVVPFSKTGGLADVSAAIPKALNELGHETIIITPLYKSIDQEIHKIKLVSTNNLAKVGKKEEVLDLYITHLPNTKVPVYFVKNQYLYREGIYVDTDGIDYKDSPMRFITFTKAVFKILENLEFSPDIIHANDWHTGYLPFYLRTEFSDSKFFKDTKTIYTIHNIGYQGIYPFESIEDARIPEIYLEEDLLGFHKQVNFMKAGIVYSTILTTVSSKYAEEIQTKEFGFGLEKIIQTRKDDLHGIVHGVDSSIWNPKIDSLIVKNYDSKNLKGKKECKSYLQEKLNLEVSDKPLLGVITRLATQKGLYLILKKFDDIMKLGAQFILLGTGESTLETQFKKKEEKYPDDCSINIMFDNVLAHQIEAASDMFLMPSKYEPCGLNQIYSMIYGTVPIVRKTGGLSDTVQDYDPETKTGSGFVFEKSNTKEFFTALKRAILLYNEEPDSWKNLTKNIMELDFSWKKVAKKWQKVYEIALAKK
ncbi:MAG: glycogen synthase GlgA [Candidatus Heimdallarchaeota archaeon]|nr:glycogen synthase GlgA [Candidatus Heimdallarchaeota archaeon]